jgi:hypothetical protein
MTFIAVALVYNVTEAGFRMMTLTWFFLLLSATVVPVVAAETASDALPEDAAPNFETWHHPQRPVSDFARRRREAI